MSPPRPFFGPKFCPNFAQNHPNCAVLSHFASPPKFRKNEISGEVLINIDLDSKHERLFSASNPILAAIGTTLGPTWPPRGGPQGGLPMAFLRPARQSRDIFRQTLIKTPWISILVIFGYVFSKTSLGNLSVRLHKCIETLAYIEV